MRINDFVSCFDNATPTYEQKQRMLKAILEQKNESGGATIIIKRKKRMSIAVALAAVLCLLLSVVAMAAFSPGFNYLLSQVSPEIALFLHPVESAHTVDGLKVEVVGAMRDENTVIVYMTIQDLTEDRLDEFTTILNCSIPGGFLTTQQTVAYDDQAKTATIRLVVEDLGVLEDGNMTLQIDSLDNWVKSERMFYSGVDLANIPTSVRTTTLEVPGVPGESDVYSGVYDYSKDVDVLEPNKTHIPIRFVDNTYISNIGIVNGNLHVQVDRQLTGLDGYEAMWASRGMEVGGMCLSRAPIDEIPTSYYCLYNEYELISTNEFRFAVDERGNIYPYFLADAENGIPHAYTTHSEYVFTKEELKGEWSDYKLLIYGHGGAVIEGIWQVDFEIEPEEIIAAQCDIDIEGLHIDRFAVSPFQIYISGSGIVTDEASFEIIITMKDGNTEKLGAVMSRNAKGEVHLKYKTWTITPEGKTLTKILAESAAVRLIPGTVTTIWLI